MQVKVATWNISGGVSKEVEGDVYFDQEKSDKIDDKFLNKIIEIINEKKIDIICFQEIITTEIVGCVQKIVKGTNLKFVETFELSECNLVENTDFGIAILSKFPILETDRYWFKNPKLTKTTKTGNIYYLYDKGAMCCRVKVDEEEMNIITNHGFPFRRFNSTPEENKDVYQGFSDFLAKYKNRIATGDFNAENPKELIQELNKMNEVNDCVTTTDGMKFDKIYVEKKYQFRDFEIFEAYSDHFMLSVQIEI